MRLVALLAVLSLSHPVAAQQPPSVTIERVAPNRWRATYRLVSPAVSLRFNRPASFFRERVWTVVTPGYRFSRRGDMQVASLASGAAPRQEIAFEFPEYANTLPKEYELFQPFTDGAVAIYTGHFRLVAFGAADSSDVGLMHFRATPGARVIVRGRVEAGDATVADSAGEGTYVYIGRATPIETADVVAIVDPGMPAWLKQMFDANVPKLFHEYALRFGSVLPWKPVVLFSFDTSGTGTSSGGGALPGLFSMVLSGSAWRTQTPAAAEQAFHLFAHESAHLWNGHLVKNAGDPWIHEGGADAVANEMLLAFGIIDSARYRAVREDAFNRCASATASGSLATASKRGANRQLYDCGFVIGMWTDAAYRKAKPGATLFTFWRQLIVAARARGGSYDDDLYFSVLRDGAVPDSVVGRMREFLATEGSIDVAVRGFRDAGIPVRAGEGDPPAAYQRDAGRDAMTHLMRQACSHVNFTSGAPLRTGAMPDCAPFASAMVVYRIQDLRVSDQGAAIYDAVRSACGANGAVTLAGDDGHELARVPCTKPLATRTPWYTMGR